MKKLVIALCAVLVLGVGVPAASAATILFEAAFNQNGTVFGLGAAPANWNLAAFDTGTGLGTITAQITGAGVHNILVFLDIEIDEPGYLFGDIYINFSAGALDNTNGVPSGSPDDVSFALGWAFTLAAGETATLNFRTSLTAPAGAFYLVQTDPASSSSVYFTSDNTIRGGSEVPEPATLLLFGTGLAGVIGLRRRKK
jgi:hypothetical protein